MAREQSVADLLADARGAFEAGGEFADLPTGPQVAERLGLSVDVLRRTAAWREYAEWSRSLCPLCAVCSRRAHTRSVRLCHTHRERWRRWGSPEPWQEWAAACRENRLNTCRRCGVRFNGSQGRIKLCGECDTLRRRERARAAWHQMSDQQKRDAVERAKARSRERHRKKLTTITCTICGREFRGFPHRVFCGNRCRQEMANRQRREIRRRIKLLQLLQQQHNLQELLDDHRTDRRQ